MGSRVQKIAFLIFALMFIAIMAVLNTSVLTMGTSANQQLTSTVSSSDNKLSVYDGSTVYGSSVVECASAPDGICSTKLEIQVKTGAGGDTTYSVDSTYSKDTDPTDSTYINKTAKFNSTLVYNSNGVVTGIVFEQA